MKKSEVLHEVLQILDSDCEKPAEEMIKLGQAMVAIGEALKGLPLADARSVVRAAVELSQ